MFTIEDLRKEAGRAPALSLVGIGGLVAATVADVAVHLESAGHDVHAGGFTPPELASHVAVLVSMVLILAGVVADGVRTNRARHQAARSRKDVA